MEQQQSSATTVLTAKNQAFSIQALWVLLFTALTAIGAQIEIPHQPVPYTLQTVFVLLAGAILGKEKGGTSQMLYLVLGAVGIPVFSHFGFGFARLFGPTGGYLLSFPVAAFVVGYLIQFNKNFLWTLVSMFTGLFIIFSLGTVQLNLIYFHNWADALTNGFLIFSWWDLLKLFAAASIYHQIAKRGIHSK